MICVLRYPEKAQYDGVKVDIIAFITTFLQNTTS